MAMCGIEGFMNIEVCSYIGYSCIAIWLHFYAVDMHAHNEYV